jgi:hypothetical protein
MRVEETEFTLSKRIVPFALAWGISELLVGIGLAVVGLLGVPFIFFFAALLIGGAIGNFVSVIKVSRCSTTLQPAGLRVRGLRAERFVPWGDIARVDVDSLMSGRTRQIRITTASGEWFRLPAPVYSRPDNDPEFDAKVDVIKAAKEQCVPAE